MILFLSCLHTSLLSVWWDEVLFVFVNPSPLSPLDTAEHMPLWSALMFNYSKQDKTVSSIWTVSALSSTLSLIENRWAHCTTGRNEMSLLKRPAIIFVFAHLVLVCRDCSHFESSRSNYLWFHEVHQFKLCYMSLDALIKQMFPDRQRMRQIKLRRTVCNLSCTVYGIADLCLKTINRMKGCCWPKVKKKETRWPQHVLHVSPPGLTPLCIVAPGEVRERVWVMESVMNSLNDSESCQIT